MVAKVRRNYSRLSHRCRSAERQRMTHIADGRRRWRWRSVLLQDWAFFTRYVNGRFVGEKKKENRCSSTGQRIVHLVQRGVSRLLQRMRGRIVPANNFISLQRATNISNHFGLQPYKCTSNVIFYFSDNKRSTFESPNPSPSTLGCRSSRCRRARARAH